MDKGRNTNMKLVDNVSKLFKDNAFTLVEVGVIATRLGVYDKKDEIQRRLYQQMFNEISSEIDKAIPVASESQLQAALEYMVVELSLKPEQRKVKLPG
jgi:hypothetical protein